MRLHQKVSAPQSK